jgi:hypothetical protein
MKVMDWMDAAASHAEAEGLQRLLNAKALWRRA